MSVELKWTCSVQHNNGRQPSELLQAGTHPDLVAKTPDVYSYYGCRVPPALDSQTVSSGPWDQVTEVSAEASQYFAPSTPCSTRDRRLDPSAEDPSHRIVLSARKCRQHKCMADCRWLDQDLQLLPCGQYLTDSQLKYNSVTISISCCINTLGQKHRSLLCLLYNLQLFYDSQLYI